MGEIEGDRLKGGSWRLLEIEDLKNKIQTFCPFRGEILECAQLFQSQDATYDWVLVTLVFGTLFVLWVGKQKEKQK